MDVVVVVYVVAVNEFWSVDLTVVMIVEYTVVYFAGGVTILTGVVVLVT